MIESGALFIIFIVGVPTLAWLICVVAIALTTKKPELKPEKPINIIQKYDSAPRLERMPEKGKPQKRKIVEDY